ncbi:hypothetical protein DCAR_0310805 [Daucus carota subsp. sativus]|uniref:Ubiquitin-like protease family profile domain-containing protein n=1 Tax=Daucus carota subsp. sativus TaxID=79200 RepID=A0AAF0WMX4_DAUCS|nr:hypothetical protein DCAR_0310805 [Daucus carota subsp. sativus]
MESSGYRLAEDLMVSNMGFYKVADLVARIPCLLNCDNQFEEGHIIDTCLELMVSNMGFYKVADLDECADGIGDDDRDMMFTSSDTGCVPHYGDGGDAVVECLPDYIVYRDKYSTDSVVTFSSSCIKIEGYWKAETFEFQWGVDHIMNIECQWCERLELATVIIRVNSKGIAPTEDVHGHTGFEEFKFAIVEDWYRKQDEIMSLDVYQPLWNIVLSSDMERDAKVLPGQSKIFPLKHYFPSFEDSFEDVIYPKGDPDAVSISKRDVDRLEPEIFVNDTIIDFYIKYLKNKIDPSERHRFHFFNSFFYPKLAELGKSLSSFVEGRAAFRSVRRWTRKISLFEKDYIFVPVNFNYHWSLIVICHPGEVADFQDSDARKSLKLPCILHMDSIRGSHSGLKGLIQSYLWEEWKERHADSSEDIFLKFSNMRFFSLELPQQQNLYDCGLFLLHYVELFLEGNLVNFNPLKISSFSNFLTANWFQPAEASLKRAYIQRLIYDMLDDGSSEPSPSNGEDEKCTSMYLKSVDKDRTTSEFLWDGSSFSKVVHESVPCSEDGQRLELGLLHSSLADSIQSANVSGFILRGPGEAEAAVESLCGAFERTRAEAAVESFCQDFEKTKAEGGQEDKSYKHSCCPSLGTTGFQEPKTSTSEACVAYLSKESGAEPLWNRESNMCQNVLMDTDSSKESICASDDLLKSKNAIHSKIGTNLSMEVKLDHHQPKFSSLGNLELFVDLRVPSSSDHMLNRNNTFSKNCGTPPRNCDALEDRSAACAPVQCICDGSGTGVQQATKKRRLAPIKEGPSLDEDLHE